MAITPAQKAEIIDRIAGGESVKTITKSRHMCCEADVYRALMVDMEFQEQYARARETQAHKYAADVVDISDNGKLAPDDRRVRIDARKWAAGKLAPKKYGEQVRHDHKHSGDLSVKSDEQLDARIAELLAKAGTAGAAGGEGPSSTDQDG